LVAVTTGELVTVGDLALLGDVDTDHLVHTGSEFVTVVAAEDTHTDDLAGLAVRHLQGGVADLAGLLPEDGAQQTLFRGQPGLTLGSDLADEDVAVPDLGPAPADAPGGGAGQDPPAHAVARPWDLP